MTNLRNRLIGELKLRNRRTATINSYVAQIYQLSKYYMLCPETLSIEQIRSYLRFLAYDKALAPDSVNVAFNAIVFLYRDVLGWDLEGRLKGIQRPRSDKTLPKFYLQSETRRILIDGTIGKPRSELFLMTIYSCGLRISEAVSLRWSCFEWEREMLRVNDGKGGKDRYLPLSPLLVGRFKPYSKTLSDSLPVFPSRKGAGRQPISPENGRALYDEAIKNSGVERKGGPHCLRHSYATHQLERGVDINTLRELMGHKSIKTTMIYLHVAKRRIETVGTPLESLFQQRRNGGVQS
ncbi:site-specific integrase [Puniceicoccaceae bacterium K14]|nr:site-specific integrase [Puniceicoccaceae bacterium K14]